MSPTIVTDHLVGLIAKQVDDHGLVVWYDPEGIYAQAAETVDLSDTTVLCYEGSFIDLRWRIDLKKLMDGEVPSRLVVYVPMAQDQTHHALIELEAAGVVMQPGQQPPARNTRLAVVARNALRGVLGDETAAAVEKQSEAGKLTLADLNALADKGGEISKGVLALIFGTGNPQEVALAFLDGDRYDEEINKKDAQEELVELLRREFDLDARAGAALDEIRQRLARQVLMTDLIVGLGDAVPSKLDSVQIASAPASRNACMALARTWRLRRDRRERYIAAATQVEQEFALAELNLDPEKIAEVETFQAIERALLRHAEAHLLKATSSEMLSLADSRLGRFWCDAEPKLQARWALVASAAEVLLEADRVEQALKKAPTSMPDLVKQYADGRSPWCQLDTHHRHMESRWHNFEPQIGDDHESIEKLIIRARQRYTKVGSDLARHFMTQIQKAKLPGKGLIRQRDIFEKHVKPVLGKEKIAYVWVDALRFEMARELARLLKEDFELDLHPAVSAVPTITEIGMAALLPCAHESAKVVNAGGGKLALEIGGKVIKDRKDRVAFLTEHAGVSVFDTKLENLLPKSSKKIREGIAGAQLILVTSQEIDELCEQDNIAQARRQMDGVLNDLRRGIRVLAEAGIERIVLTSDHGHLFAEELSEDMKVDAPGGETVDLHRRVWVGRGGTADDAYVRAPLTALGMEGDFDLAAPWTFACFKAKGGGRTYFHGGLSPQELIVPLLVLQPIAKAVARPPSGMEWKITPGSQKLTTRFFSVLVEGRNTGLFELKPPKVRVELRAKGKSVSRPVSASYGFDEATGDVVLKKDEASPQDIAPNTITLMVVEEVDQKTVGVYLIAGASGAELTRVEKIEVAIAM
ncbi:MAG: hypothetical protein A2139_12160 [Desulfobacca sp. RBG_16_60_12]|nr:MAG: hypothetical protein A2139_12160 [Desulfobacca sp. RBG_16_60_12]